MEDGMGGKSNTKERDTMRNQYIVTGAANYTMSHV
jgi:hypothetical protein